MQPVTIVENRPSRSGYSEGYSIGAATCVSVMLLLCAIGAVICGAIVYVPLGVFSPILYQIIAFIQCVLYFLTALIGFGTTCKFTCMIVFFMIACILSTLASLGGLGWFCYEIYAFVIVGSFTDCQGVCLYIAIPICVLAFLSLMAFIAALTGSIFCCKGMSSSSYSDGRGPSAVMVTQQSAPPHVIKY